MMDQQTVSLLRVEKAKSGGYRSTRLYPAAMAILNLFFCAYVERYLKTDTNGFYLMVFFFLEATFYVGVSLVNFYSVSCEILEKSRVFPTTASGRLLFVIAGNLRRPMVLSFVASNAFFLIILFRQTMSLAVATAALFALLIIVTETVLSTAVLIVMRRSVPRGTVIVWFGLFLLSALVGSFVFHYESLLAMNPLLRWTINGILAAKESNTFEIAINVALLLMTGVISVIFGRRFA